MLFNSIQFLIFFPAVVILFWILPWRWKNPMLLIASYYFYMNWQPAFGLLLLISTLATWGGALLIDRWRESDPRRSRIAFRTTLIFNLAMLFVFKYLQFVGDEIRNLLFSLGVGIEIPEFTILLPVGISFFIFQAVGYLIDVRRATIAPERNLGIFALFIAFFPQLVAGPIERAANMLP
ncbi:MAG: MBOAT family protein, partial [Muribaculaceae bacterium]|nr:MBOAT family protein [Muribaculaceae bacterium]